MPRATSFRSSTLAAAGHVARRTPRLLALAVAVALIACGGGAPAAPEDGAGGDAQLRAAGVPSSAPGIRGTITRIVYGDSVVAAAGRGANPDASVSCPPTCGPSGSPLRRILVEEVPGMESGGDKSMLAMPASARVLRRAEGGLVAAGFTELRVGQQVSAWFDGPVAESYPSQARGLVVVIEP